MWKKSFSEEKMGNPRAYSKMSRLWSTLVWPASYEGGHTKAVQFTGILVWKVSFVIFETSMQNRTEKIKSTLYSANVYWYISKFGHILWLCQMWEGTYICTFFSDFQNHNSVSMYCVEQLSYIKGEIFLFWVEQDLNRQARWEQLCVWPFLFILLFNNFHSKNKTVKTMKNLWLSVIHVFSDILWPFLFGRICFSNKSSIFIPKTELFKKTKILWYLWWSERDIREAKHYRSLPLLLISIHLNRSLFFGGYSKCKFWLRYICPLLHLNKLMIYQQANIC